MTRTNPIIVALDTSSSLRALYLVRHLKVAGVGFKVGTELFVSQGPKIVEKIVRHDVRVFLDLKFHDIPNTVARGSEGATRLGVWMFNVHAVGGVDMMRSAKMASAETASKLKIEPPLVIGVTVLTSLEKLPGSGQDPSSRVLELARSSRESGLDGVVASGMEAFLIRKEIGPSFTIVTPGIRLPSSPPDDQKRVATPAEALKGGANYLVVGRPITQSRRPMKVVEEILQSLS